MLDFSSLDSGIELVGRLIGFDDGLQIDARQVDRLPTGRFSYRFAN